jgi:hypothetical protein
MDMTGTIFTCVLWAEMHCILFNHPEVMNSHIYTEVITEAYKQLPQPNIKHTTVFMLRHADDAQVTIDDTTLNNYGIKVLMLETAVNDDTLDLTNISENIHTITQIRNNLNAAFYDYILELARIILTENYINAWPHGIYQQISGTAMGTAFAVMYAVIFMIHYEEPIKRQLYKNTSC